MSTLPSSITIPQFNQAKGHQLFTELTFNQPNITASLSSFQMEDFLNTDNTFLQDMVKERMRVLSVFHDDILAPVISAVRLKHDVNPYDVKRVKYTELNRIDINPITGLKDKIRMNDYLTFLDDVMEDAIRVFDVDLPLLTGLVARAISDKKVLHSNIPTTSISDLIVNSTDGDGLRKVVTKFVTAQNNPKPKKFGDYYYSTDEWLKANNQLIGLKQKLKRVPTDEFSKKIDALNILLDKFVKKAKLDKDINKEKLKLMADLIEKTSNTIAVAGGIIHLATNVIFVMGEHNTLVNNFLEERL